MHHWYHASVRYRLTRKTLRGHRNGCHVNDMQHISTLNRRESMVVIQSLHSSN